MSSVNLQQVFDAGKTICEGKEFDDVIGLIHRCRYTLHESTGMFQDSLMIHADKYFQKNIRKYVDNHFASLSNASGFKFT